MKIKMVELDTWKDKKTQKKIKRKTLKIDWDQMIETTYRQLMMFL